MDFFDCLMSLKTESINLPSDFKKLLSDYENIVDVSITGPEIPKISLQQSSKIL